MDESFFDLYILKNFFDVATSSELIKEMRSCATAPALTYGKGDAAVDERIRRVRQVSISPESASFVDVYGEAGMLVAFRSELTHEITPVTHGDRYAIVSWYRGSD